MAETWEMLAVEREKQIKKHPEIAD